jgi:hypothetical protein
MVLTACFVLAPETGLVVSVAGAMRQHCRQLDISIGTSGRHDFAVRVTCIRLLQRASTASRSNVRDDRDTPLLWARDARRNASDLPVVTSENTCGTLARRANHLGEQNGCQAHSNSLL